MRLTAEQKALLETQFPAELEKEAAAEVAKIQELYSVGFEKMAAEAAEAMDKSEEEEEEEKKELSKEQEKEASARAAFIARGYIDGLKKEGSERHGDELHYLYPALEEKLAGFTDHAKSLLNKAKRHNPFSAAAIAASSSKKTKDGLMDYAKKKGMKGDDAKLVSSMKDVSKNKLKAAKEVAHKRQLIGAGLAGTSLGVVGGRFSKKGRDE